MAGMLVWVIHNGTKTSTYTNHQLCYDYFLQAKTKGIVLWMDVENGYWDVKMQMYPIIVLFLLTSWFNICIITGAEVGPWLEYMLL